MNFATFLENFPLILTECAISEQLRRRTDITLHPTLFNTPLIYQEKGRKYLQQIYYSYHQVATDTGLPLLLCAPTWRIDRRRIKEAGASQCINEDAVAFIKEIENSLSSSSAPVVTGALLAPANDCYRPEQALSREQAAEYHGWQIDRLAATDTAVIIAQTIPALTEACGMADRLSATGMPYIISFVINSSAKVLDGTPVAEAIEQLDQSVSSPPTGYMVNCVYPTFLLAEQQSPPFFQRLIGIQANASSKDHHQLDGASQLQQNPIADWGKEMIKLHRDFGVKILGGCCGTDHNYLRYIAENLVSPHFL